MFRVNRFAAAIAMMADGTSAPMAMAAYAMPANQLGKFSWNRCGTASCALATPSDPNTDVPAAMAAKPSNASRPSNREYAGRIDAFRRIVLRLLADSTAVTAWGYMNKASAEPKASDAYAQ